MNCLMEKLQRKYICEKNCKKKLNQQNCMLMKKSVKRRVTQLKKRRKHTLRKNYRKARKNQKAFGKY